MVLPLLTVMPTTGMEKAARCAAASRCKASRVSSTRRKAASGICSYSGSQRLTTKQRTFCAYNSGMYRWPSSRGLTRAKNNVSAGKASDRLSVSNRSIS